MKRHNWYLGGIFLFAIVALAINAFADEPAAPNREKLNQAIGKIYQPIGAPADPKVDVRWNLYHDYAAATDILKRLAAAHPQRTRLQSLGRSQEGREMWVLTVTNFANDKDKPTENQKAGFWIDGGIHANEVQASEVVLYTAWYLLENYGRNERITQLVDSRVFYLMPMMSPDSRDAHMHKPNTTHSPRSGQRPVDDDQDGRVNEDGPDDLDNDGSITQMRIKDPNGRHKPHPDYPNVMIPAKPDEKGSYTLLGSEGIDNDGDGQVNEDGDGSYDPNRDWPWNWQPKHVQRGAFRYPFSLIENRVVGEFIAAHPNIAGAQSYHNTGGMILRGPGAKDDRYDPVDLKVYDVIGKKGETLLPGYNYINIANDLYEVYGGEVDWLYQMQGVFTFTNELFTTFNYQRKAEVNEGLFARGEVLQQFNRDLLLDEGFVKWHEVTHPKYGKIEVGGMKKNWTRQPPSFLLEEECHRNMAFTLLHADQMPRVVIQNLSVKKLSKDGDKELLLEIMATITNERLIPTHATVDVKNKITPPDEVTLSGEKFKVIASQWSSEQFFESPHLSKREPATVKLPNLPGMEARYVKWIVSGEGPFTVDVKSVKGGVASKMIEK